MSKTGPGSTVARRKNITWSPYTSDKDTIAIEREMAKRRYLLRKMKQNIRPEYQQWKKTDGKSIRIPSEEELSLLTMGSVKIHIHGCQHLRGTFHGLKNNKKQLLCSSYVEVYYRSHSDANVQWETIIKKCRTTVDRDPKQIGQVFGFRNKEGWKQDPKWSVPVPVHGTEAASFPYSDFSGYVGKTDICYREKDEVQYKLGSFDFKITKPSLESMELDWNQLNGEILLQVSSLGKNNDPESTEPIGHHVIPLSKLLDQQHNTSDVRTFRGNDSLPKQFKYGGELYHCGPQRGHLHASEIHAPLGVSNSINDMYGRIMFHAQVYLPLPSHKKMLKDIYSLVSDNSEMGYDRLPKPRKHNPTWKSWENVDVPAPKHVSDILFARVATVVQQDLDIPKDILPGVRERWENRVKQRLPNMELTEIDWNDKIRLRRKFNDAYIEKALWGGERFLCDERSNDDMKLPSQEEDEHDVTYPPEHNKNNKKSAKANYCYKDLVGYYHDNMKSTKKKPVAGYYYDPNLLSGNHATGVHWIGYDFGEEETNKKAFGRMILANKYRATENANSVSWLEKTNAFNMNYQDRLCVLRSDTKKGGAEILGYARSLVAAAKQHLVDRSEDVSKEIALGHGFLNKMKSVIDPDYLKLSHKQRVLGHLVVKIIRAENLPAGDVHLVKSMATSDPYVSIHLSDVDMNGKRIMAFDATEEYASASSDEASSETKRAAGKLSLKDQKKPITHWVESSLYPCWSSDAADTEDPVYARLRTKIKDKKVDKKIKARADMAAKGYKNSQKVSGRKRRNIFRIPVYDTSTTNVSSSNRPGTTLDGSLVLKVFDYDKIGMPEELGEAQIAVRDYVINAGGGHGGDILLSDLKVKRTEPKMLSLGIAPELDNKESKAMAKQLSARGSKLLVRSHFVSAEEWCPHAQEEETKNENEDAGEAEVLHNEEFILHQARELLSAYTKRITMRQQYSFQAIQRRNQSFQRIRDVMEKDYFDFVKPKPFGRLIVQVLSAKKLPHMDLVMSSKESAETDAFAFVELEGKIHRTETMPNDCSPIWKTPQEFAFDISSTTANLKVSMWDENGVKEDPVPLGEINVSFIDFASKTEIKGNYFLQKDLAKEKAHKANYRRVVKELKRLEVRGAEKSLHEQHAEYQTLKAKVKHLDGQYRDDYLQYQKRNRHGKTDKIANEDETNVFKSTTWTKDNLIKEGGYGEYYYPIPTSSRDKNPQGSVQLKLKYFPLVDALDNSGNLRKVIYGNDIRGKVNDTISKSLNRFPVALQDSEQIQYQARVLRSTLQQELSAQPQIPALVRQTFGKIYSEFMPLSDGAEFSQNATINLGILEAKDIAKVDLRSSSMEKQIYHNVYVKARVVNSNTHNYDVFDDGDARGCTTEPWTASDRANVAKLTISLLKLKMQYIDLELEILRVKKGDLDNSKVIDSKIETFDAMKKRMDHQLRALETLLADSTQENDIVGEIPQETLDLLLWKEKANDVDFSNFNLWKTENEKRAEFRIPHTPNAYTFVNVVEYNDSQIYRVLLQRETRMNSVQKVVEHLKSDQTLVSTQLTEALNQQNPDKTQILDIKKRLRETMIKIREKANECRKIFPLVEQHQLNLIRERLQSSRSITTPCAWFQRFAFTGIQDLESSTIEVNVMEKSKAFHDEDRIIGAVRIDAIDLEETIKELLQRRSLLAAQSELERKIIGRKIYLTYGLKKTLTGFIEFKKRAARLGECWKIDPVLIKLNKELRGVVRQLENVASDKELAVEHQCRMALDLLEIAEKFRTDLTPMTGTITIEDNVVHGIGTKFITDLGPGYVVCIQTNARSKKLAEYTVVEVKSDTECIVLEDNGAQHIVNPVGWAVRKESLTMLTRSLRIAEMECGAVQLDSDPGTNDARVNAEIELLEREKMDEDGFTHAEYREEHKLWTTLHHIIVQSRETLKYSLEEKDGETVLTAWYKLQHYKNAYTTPLDGEIKLSLSVNRTTNRDFHEEREKKRLYYRSCHELGKEKQKLKHDVIPRMENNIMGILKIGIVSTLKTVLKYYGDVCSGAMFEARKLDAAIRHYQKKAEPFKEETRRIQEDITQATELLRDLEVKVHPSDHERKEIDRLRRKVKAGKIEHKDKTLRMNASLKNIRNVIAGLYEIYLESSRMCRLTRTTTSKGDEILMFGPVDEYNRPVSPSLQLRIDADGIHACAEDSSSFKTFSFSEVLLKCGVDKSVVENVVKHTESKSEPSYSFNINSRQWYDDGFSEFLLSKPGNKRSAEVVMDWEQNLSQAEKNAYKAKVDAKHLETFPDLVRIPLMERCFEREAQFKAEKFAEMHNLLLEPLVCANGKPWDRYFFSMESNDVHVKAWGFYESLFNCTVSDEHRSKYKKASKRGIKTETTPYDIDDSVLSVYKSLKLKAQQELQFMQWEKVDNFLRQGKFKIEKAKLATSTGIEDVHAYVIGAHQPGNVKGQIVIFKEDSMFMPEDKIRFYDGCLYKEHVPDEPFWELVEVEIPILEHTKSEEDLLYEDSIVHIEERPVESQFFDIVHLHEVEAKVVEQMQNKKALLAVLNTKFEKPAGQKESEADRIMRQTGIDVKEQVASLEEEISSLTLRLKLINGANLAVLQGESVDSLGEEAVSLWAHLKTLAMKGNASDGKDMREAYGPDFEWWMAKELNDPTHGLRRLHQIYAQQSHPKEPIPMKRAKIKVRKHRLRPARLRRVDFPEILAIIKGKSAHGEIDGFNVGMFEEASPKIFRYGDLNIFVDREKIFAESSLDSVREINNAKQSQQHVRATSRLLGKAPMFFTSMWHQVTPTQLGRICTKSESESKSIGFDSNEHFLIQNRPSFVEDYFSAEEIMTGKVHFNDLISISIRHRKNLSKINAPSYDVDGVDSGAEGELFAADEDSPVNLFQELDELELLKDKFSPIANLGGYCICVVDKTSKKPRSWVVPVLPTTTVEELKTMLFTEYHCQVPLSAQVLKCSGTAQYGEELLVMKNFRSMSSYNITPDLGVSEENGTISMASYNDIVETEINTNEAWRKDPELTIDDLHYANLGVILRALENGGRALRYYTNLLLQMRNCSENTKGIRGSVYMDLFYDCLAMSQNKTLDEKLREIGLMTDEEKLVFDAHHVLEIKTVLTIDNCSLATYDIASVRKMFVDDDDESLLKILEKNSLIPKGPVTKESKPYDFHRRMLEFAIISKKVEEFSNSSARRQQEEAIGECLSHQLVGPKYELAVLNLRRYIKETLNEKTYNARKFLNNLSYEEREEQILRNESVELDKADVHSPLSLEIFYSKYGFNKIQVFLSTSINEIGKEIFSSEAKIKSLSKNVHALGPSSQQEAITVCSLVQQKFNEMKRTLDDVKSDYDNAYNDRHKLEYGEKNVDQDEEDKLNKERDDKRDKLHKQWMKNQNIKHEYENNNIVLPLFGPKLFGTQVSEIYDPSMDEDTYDVVERLIGHGAGEHHYNVRKISTEDIDKRVKELEELELKSVIKRKNSIQWRRKDEKGK
jgi:hypothetical protein